MRVRVGRALGTHREARSRRNRHRPRPNHRRLRKRTVVDLPGEEVEDGRSDAPPARGAASGGAQRLSHIAIFGAKVPTAGRDGK